MSRLLDALDRRVLVFDGAMGTMIHAAALGPADWGGVPDCPEILNVTRPDVIEGIHAAYFEAGCDIVETNTFGGTPLVLAEFGVAERCHELNVAAAQNARRAADRYTTPEQPRFVSGSLGPGTKAPSLGQVPFRVLRDAYRQQAEGLLAGGVDLLQIETCFDILQTKAAVLGVRDALANTGQHVPVMVTVTVETVGTMLLGTEVAAVPVTLEPFDAVEILGLNCATGPDLMHEHVVTLAKLWPRRLAVLPNAGLPENRDGHAHFPLTPAQLAAAHREFVSVLGVNAVGGCCGTTPKHIAAVVAAMRGLTPASRTPVLEPSATSLYSAATYRQEPPPLFVGERTNANGSKHFRDLLLAGKWDEMVSLAKGQQKGGAHLLDVCVAYVGRDEVADCREVLRRFATQVTLPLVLDSTEAPVLEEALQWIGGKPVINSINLEDGEGKARRVLSLCREYGAAVVALTIDERGMAKDVDTKVAVARRLYALCREYGVRAHDIFFDPLTFTLGAGDAEFRKAGVATIEAITRIKAELPGVNTLLGVSNISFGLKPAARHVLNSVFLHHAVQAGLDAAIVHAASITPLFKIDPEARRVAEDLVFDRRVDGVDPLHAFMALFEGVKAQRAEVRVDAPVEERLPRHIVDGEREGLTAALDQAMAQGLTPLEIINRFLLAGMATVGELFGSGQMQLPFVLQSAEVMKAAVAHLEPFMDKVQGSERGTIVLATVKGDVHDIGKNLVDILLTNNGYKVVNLGIKQPIEVILEAAERHDAHAIGLSGLLVKSTVVMKESLEEMNRRALTRWPVILGGAALTRRYVEDDLRSRFTGQVYYASDAFDGLYLMDEIVDPEKPRKLTAIGQRPVREEVDDALEQADLSVSDDVRSDHLLVSGADVPVPAPPFWGARVVEAVPLDEVVAHVNTRALFRGQWQFKQGALSLEQYEALVRDTVEPLFAEWTERCRRDALLQPQVAYGYFPCNAMGNELVIWREPDGRTERLRFRLPRQRKNKRLCIADYFAPLGSGQVDVVALTAVTVGPRASEAAQALFQANKYTDYLYLHGLSVECAEALAEWVHRRARLELGIASDDGAAGPTDWFKGRYRGARYSFGYPACPALEDQGPLLELLGAERIGLSLTEEHQLVPEQSTTALVVHHPQAHYFRA